MKLINVNPLCILIYFDKLDVSSSNFQQKIVSRTGFEMKNFILDSSAELGKALISLIKMSKIHSN